MAPWSHLALRLRDLEIALGACPDDPVIRQTYLLALCNLELLARAVRKAATAEPEGLAVDQTHKGPGL